METRETQICLDVRLLLSFLQKIGNNPFSSVTLLKETFE